MNKARVADKWTAFVLSLALPGAGQLFAGSAWCLAWFAIVAVLSVSPTALDLPNPLATPAVRVVAFLLVAVLSAEHAKRCLEPRRRRGGTRNVRSRVARAEMRGSAVHLRVELDVPRPPHEVWAELADIERFATIDPFHSRVIVMGPKLRPGVDLTLEHRAFGFTLLRFGRLLRWRDGRGYAFSDLSARDRLRGFPHVFFLDIEPTPSSETGGTRVRLDVRGKWTATFIPRWLGLCWLRYVMAEHSRLLRAAL